MKGEPRSRRLRPARRAAVIALAALILLPHTAQPQAKSHKRFYFGLIGAAVLGVPAYAFTSDRTFKSACSSRTCVGLAAGLIGGTIGFLVGSELDRKYELRMRAGPTLEYRTKEIPLDLVPDRIVAFPGGVAVAGVGGARLVFRDGTIFPRGSGVRGIEDVAVLPQKDLLVLSTFSSLIGFPVRNDTAQGEVIDAEGGGAMEAIRGRLAVATVDSLRLLGVHRADHEYSVERLAAVASPDFVSDMAFSPYSGVTWVLSEDRLASYGADLEPLGEVVLPAPARTVRSRGGRLAVAAGTHGVYVLDARDPRAPRVVQHYTGVRFAYAADISGDTLFVAAGPEGLAVVDISGAEPKVMGVARRARFVTNVIVAGGGEVWILDRDGRTVQLAEFGRAGERGAGGSH